ncbi:hypothetical protein EDD85DRAFT_378742 [Armillaria nabsnona]|nr:hypothetical protein EDD85DRAFT_378742 [Armillaria nabsnona]
MPEYFSSPCHDASSALSTIVTSLVVPSFTIAQGCVVPLQGFFAWNVFSTSPIPQAVVSSKLAKAKENVFEVPDSVLVIRETDALQTRLTEAGECSVMKSQGCWQHSCSFCLSDFLNDPMMMMSTNRKRLCYCSYQKRKVVRDIELGEARRCSCDLLCGTRCA